MCSVSKSLQDTKAQAIRIEAQAEVKLEKKETELRDTEKANVAALKQMKEDYENKVLMVQKQFEKDKKKLEEEVEQEKVKVKETKEEQQLKVTKAEKAFGNIVAATTGASQSSGMVYHLPGRWLRLVPASRRHVRARLFLAATWTARLCRLCSTDTHT